MYCTKFQAHLWIPRIVMDYLWDLLLKKKNVSSCRGGSQTPAKTHENCDFEALFYKISFKTYLSLCIYLVYLSIYFYLSIYLSAYLSIFLSSYLSIFLSIKFMKDFWVLAMNDFWNRLPQTKNVSSCNYNFLPPLCKAIQNPPISIQNPSKAIKSHPKSFKSHSKSIKHHQYLSNSIQSPFKIHPKSIKILSKSNKQPFKNHQTAIQNLSKSNQTAI